MQLNRTIIMTLIAVMAALGALWFTNGAVTPKEATWDDVLAEAKNGGYRIITTQELGAAYTKNRQRDPSGGHPPGVGVPHRAHQGRDQLSRWNRPGGRDGARRTR